MRKFRVHGYQVMSVTMIVELSDEELETLAADREVTVDQLDEDDLRDTVFELADGEGIPSLCAQCTGWRQSWSRDEEELDFCDEDPELDYRMEEITGE